MVQITTPIDVPHVNPTNELRTLDRRPNPVWQTVGDIAAHVQEITDRAREQQIENNVRTAALNLRTRLDQVRTNVEDNPDYTTMQERWQAQAGDVAKDIGETLQSPAEQRAWRAQAQEMLGEEGRYIYARQQTRGVEAGRSGLIATVGALQRAMVDPNSTIETRAQSMASIEGAIQGAQNRQVISADDGARMLEQARNQLAEYQRSEGLRQQSMAEEDRIWSAAGGDYAVAQQMVREIRNPELRDATDDRVAQRHAREVEGTQDQVRQAMGRAWGLIEAHGNLDGLTQADRQVIIASGNMDALRNYARARSDTTGASWTAMQRNSQRARDLMLGNAATPGARAQAMARFDLNAPISQDDARNLGLPADMIGKRLRDVLMPDDYNQLELRQRQLRGDAPVSGNATLVDQAYGRILPLAQRRAATLGVNVTGSVPGSGNSSEDQLAAQRTRATFESYLYNRVREYVQSQNGMPSQAELDGIINEAMHQSVVVTSFTVGGHPLFETGRRPVYQFQTGTNDFVARVPYARIPSWQVERLARIWAAQGHDVAPTQAQIEEMYAVDMAGGTQ